MKLNIYLFLINENSLFELNFIMRKQFLILNFVSISNNYFLQFYFILYSALFYKDFKYQIQQELHPSKFHHKVYLMYQFQLNLHIYLKNHQFLYFLTSNNKLYIFKVHEDFLFLYPYY